ncbi:MAG: hypothetical protein WCU80_09185 [Paludibacteraceae bacterium]|nr:hypothetical protein [Prevotellaceae bacterium]
MNNLKSYILMAITLLSMQAQSAVQLKWSASANETKKIYSITGSYTIDWGDGNSSSTTSHTYTTAGDYTILISGSVSAIDLRGDDSSTGASGITSFSLTENDNTLATLNIWGNTSLSAIDVTKAVGLSQINATADPISTLDLSKNTLLESIDLKMCSQLSELMLSGTYGSLRTVDVNNSALTACALNALFEALPTASGNIYTVSCTGDATSNPALATAKGWKFSNGGTGDASSVCKVPLTAVTEVLSSKISSGYSVSWTGAESAEGYSVRVNGIGGDLCEASFYTTTGESAVVTAEDPDNSVYYVYSISGTEYVMSGPYTFPASSGTEDLVQTTGNIIYSIDKEIHFLCEEIGKTLRLYDAKGVLISTKTASDNEVIFKAGTGDYLLQIDDETVKVIVK